VTVSQIHPEDLLDKDARGKLTAVERARLEAHLADCATCRFERQVRLDFADELDDEAELSTQQLLAVMEGLPERPTATVPAAKDGVRANDTQPPMAPPSERPSSRPRRQARRRATLGMLVAAALFVGSVATAGAGARVWAQLSATFGGTTDAAERAMPAATEATEVTPMAHKARPARAPRATEPEIFASAEPIEQASPTEIATPVSLSPPVAPVAATATITTASLPVRATLSGRQPEGAANARGVEAFAGPETAASLFEDANEARSRGEYARAIFIHRRLEALFPKSREAQVSYATIGRLQLDRGDADGALASFDAYAARGAGPLDEAALVGRATALDRLGRTAEARAAWRTLLTAFPATPYASHARTRIDLHEGSDGASPR
jgi:TolA-binding protein